MNITITNHEGETTTVEFKQPIYATFEPKEDITAYELALCIKQIEQFRYRMVYDVPDDEYMRHFEVIGDEVEE